LNLRRALHLVGAGALTGALLLGTAPSAAADNIRDMQWALQAFDAASIWQHSTGKGVVVAVVDTGVDASQPDLKGQVLKGKDFTNEGGSAHDDLVGHGTGMAGLIAAQGHGQEGGAGVKGLAPDAKILPIRFEHEKGETGVNFASGIRFAVDHGADVINISQGTSRDTREMKAIEYAIQRDVVVVAAAGNSSSKQVVYPAAYPGVLTVGGVDNQGRFWKGSSWGSNTSLLGPAVNNVIADPTSASGYARATGTSNAAAFVSASAALVRSAHPDLTAGQVINRLIKTAKIPTGADPNSKLPDPKFGYGIVRPLRAVTYDIPAGPKAGPLEQPTEGTSSQSAPASPPADADQQSASDDQSSSSSNILVYVLIGLGALVVLVIVVVLIAKKNKGGGNGPQGPAGGGGYMPPMPHQGNQQYQAPSGQFGPPPPPNQPPAR
jgi:type VII secretion-associated serine protease mycosin